MYVCMFVEVRLRGVRRRMIKMMCGTRLVDCASSVDLCQIVGIDKTIDELIVQSRFHLYGHVLRREKDSSVRKVLQIDIKGKKSQGRQKKT